MIPAALASQLTQGLADFLRFSFASTTPGLERVIESFLATPGAVLKGPYVSLKLPFTPGTNRAFFPKLPLRFTPHAHQERAFERLGPRRKRSTLVATGTGSGKTESFLLPILDHCLTEAGSGGIKAILVYPMNALATDQAKRIAGLIHESPHLRGTVRAGLYIGESKTHSGSVHEMTATEVVTDRELLQGNPPDILLTNYKMLDYLLLRPKDQRIWSKNGRGTLRFLVVDELHTFDGAQGTDLACLIRRLKRRLQADDGSLCCVGTSATLGGPAAAAELRRYAESVFGEPFDPDSVITESRLSVAQFLADHTIEHTQEPIPADLPTLDPARADDRDAWLRAQVFLWLAPRPDEAEAISDPWLEAAPDAWTDAWKVELGQRLRRHAAFRALVEALGSGTRSVDDIAQTMARSRSTWRQDPAFARAAVLSLLALVSVARALPPARPEDAGTPTAPTSLLDVRLQLWQRELSRMVLSVGPQPRLRFSDDLSLPERRQHLPAIHCRDCGAMGWATKIDRDASRVLRTELRSFYTAFFAADSRVRFLFPAAAVPVGDPQWEKAQRYVVDTKRLVALDTDEDPDGEAFELVAPPNTRSIPGGRELHRDCPFCGARGSLALVGFQAATLTSVHVDQVFASPFNEDKKLLTFSDSVQDASHRAGFFGARTWQTNLRIAMVHVLRERDGLSLAELGHAMSEVYRDELEPAAWISTFIAPNMLWLHDWDALQKKGTLPAGSDLAELVARRLAFEAVTELCLHANIGRSLPRTRSATVFVDPERLRTATERILPRVRNELPGMRETTPAALRSFVLGMLHALRQRGGVCHRELPTRYIESGGSDNYVYKQWVHLPSYGKNARMPALLSDRTGTARFDSYEGPSASNWYARWADRCFFDGRALIADASSTYGLVVPVLVAEGLLVEHHGTRGERFWGLPDTALRVTWQVLTARCTTCNHVTTVARPEAEAWHELPCTTARCAGHYALQPTPATESSYFGRLYAKGDLQRIFSAEHTGLLDPHDRKQIEIAFKAPEPPPGMSVSARLDPEAPVRYRLPWDPNLLSCTPTLEMGIDIGDLSSTFLCSVPPAQANYLQRIGRAGRRDGNSLVLTVANARDHDQYFYALPEEMMSGDVLPPGVFLDAAAVLERQLTAFCFDRWVATASPDAPVELPEMLRDVFASVGTPGSAKFPYDLLAFVEREQAALVREFSEMFAGALGDAALEHLRRFLAGGGGPHVKVLSLRLVDAFHEELEQRDSLRIEASKNRDEIKRLRALEAQPADMDERIEQLESEKEARIALARGIDKRLTLEFLTDQGLLPNYAFPESAVRLSSVIWRRKKEAPAKGSKYDTWTYEYVRTPASALSELAPNAEFYAGGRHVRIDQVDVAASEVETWRFCDACTHAERIDGGDAHAACPGCGSTMWPDDGQKLRMLRLRQVYANAPDRESRTRDDRDERRPRFFVRQMLVEVHDEHRAGAWQLEGGVPFGFEYLRRATFRDINFGEPREQGAKTTVAGRGSIRPGFEICLRCGKVQRHGKDPEHTLACASRKKGTKPEIEPCLYLYREFSSEALRLLLPMTDIGVQRRLSSFVAALQLGLRERFGGSVDHLRTTVYDEPVEGSALRRHYLVLFDTVPGGTGYIHQLVTPDEQGQLPLLFQVLALAKQRIEGCACWNDPERDGCYRCLYGYRNSRERDETSASTAVQVLDGILAGVRDGKLVEIESIGRISITGLMDSVLEARFIEALRHATTPAGKPARVQDRLYSGKHCYLLSLGDNEWMVEPQVEVTAGTLRSKADFVLRPVTGPRDRELSIVVYLDGWEFHKHDIGFDLALRTALQVRDGYGRYDVWSFTWFDLDAVLLERSPSPPKNLVHRKPSKLKALLQKMGLQKHATVVEQPILETFFHELAAPEPGPWKEIGQSILAGRMTPAHASHRREWGEAVREHVPEWDQPSWKAIDPRLAADVSDEDEDEDDDSASPADPFFQLHAVHDGERLAAVGHLDDDPDNLEHPGFRATWNGMLNLFTLLRAVPSLWFVTRRGLTEDSRAYHTAWLSRVMPDIPTWQSFDEIHEDFRSLAQTLMEAGIRQPQVGYELLDARGDTWAETELAWEDRRVALSGRSRLERAHGQPEGGWRVFLLEDLAGDPSQLIAALR